MAVKCPKCHSENPETKQFCADCGTRLFPSEKGESRTETLERASEELARGTVFAGRYEIVEELGKGGMGRVYRAEDTKIRAEIALKLIKPEISSDKKTIERFSNELKTARMISHRNVCRMFDLGEYEGSYFITMEYVPGEDLKSLIRMSKQLAAGTAISIARQVCEGLAEAHRLGVVHRDLKPSNIMIDKHGNARIMDFGIARSLQAQQITGAGIIVGTPEYMSPEQAEAKEVDNRSDIYSLGVILYEMVTGRVPFEGDTPLSIVMKHKGETPKAPAELNAQVPHGLSRMILRCLEKDKADRYQSVEELGSELTRVEEDIPTAERSLPKRKPTRPKEIASREAKPKREKVALYAGVAIILALIGFAGLRLLPNRSEVIDSIAVLPFENVNADRNADYLCDGITETIINKLTQLSSFKTVICRDSVFTYKDRPIDPKMVGRELGVKAVLLTRLVRVGDRLTISPTLVRTKDNSQIWGDRYDRKFEDIFSIEEDIAASIVQALRLKVTQQDQQRIFDRSIDNAAAYECYLRAYYEISRFKKDSLDRAVQDLQRALDIIGPNPLLFSAMAGAYYGYVNIGVQQESYLARAEDYARKALAIDPSFSKAHSVLGTLYYFKDPHEAIRHYRMALASNPNELRALFGLAIIYLDSGKPSAALPLIERHREVDPLNPNNFALRGTASLYEGQFRSALDSFRKWYQSDPENPAAEYYYAVSLAYNKAYDEAFSIIEKCARADPDNALSKFGLLLKYGLQKDKERAFQVMTSDFKKTCQRDLEWSYELARAFALLDDKKEALDWLENAVRRGYNNYLFINEHDTFLETIRGEERFKCLMELVKNEWEHFEK